MNKIDLINVIVDKVELIKVDVGCVFEVFFEIVQKVFKKGDDVLVVGFGIFIVCKCVVCMGCNLCINEMIKIKVLKVLVFKVGKILKDVLN